MRHVLVKNVGQVVQAVTDWDGVSHINVKKNHTLVQSDDPKVLEGVQVNLEALQTQAAANADTRKAALAAAEAESRQRHLDRAKALIAGSTASQGSQPAAA